MNKSKNKKFTAEKTEDKKSVKPKVQGPLNNLLFDSKFLLPGILLLTIIIYYRSFSNDFVLNWDDENFILKNTRVQELSTGMLTDIFTSFFRGNYFPLTAFCYALEYHFFGTQPQAYHVLNVTIHLASIYFLFHLVKKLTGRIEAAAITALLFGIHPMQVESVAWIAELKNLLYGLFFILSLLQYLRFLDSARYKYLLSAFLFFVLSSLSKSAATPLPVVLILVDIYRGRKVNTISVIEKVPFIIVSLAIGIIAIFAQQEAHALQDLSVAFSFSDRIFLTTYQVMVYLLKLFAPVNLSAFYYYPSASLGWEYFISPFIILLVIITVYKAKKMRRDLIFGLMFFIVSISVMLQLIPFGGAIIAERYVYIPYIGLFIIIGLFYCNVSDNIFAFSSKLKKPLPIVMTGFILFLAITAFNRVPVWKNSVTLFTDVIEKNPDRDFGYQYRGVARAMAGDYKGCIEDQDEAISINPKYPEAYYSRGLAKMSTGGYKSGFEDFQKAVEYKKDYYDAYNNMGTAMIKFKQFDKALGYFDKVLQFKPGFTLAYYNKGVCFYYLNNMPQACVFWGKAADLGYPKAIEMKQKFCR